MRSGIEAGKKWNLMRVLGQGILMQILHILLQLMAMVLVGNLGRVRIKILVVTNAKILLFNATQQLKFTYVCHTVPRRRKC